MGTGEAVVAVADAGPLIHLSEIGCLPLLRQFGVLHIPEGVWIETVGQGRISEDDLLRLGLIQRHTLADAEVLRFIPEKSLDKLHRGECECLYLSLQTSVLTLLTDDLAVRQTAQRLNLLPVGSLGVVVRAYRLGHIELSAAEHYLFTLHEVSSLFVTRTIVELAVEQLRKP